MRKHHLLPLAIAIVFGFTACQNENRNNRDQAAINVTDTTTDTTLRAQMYTSDVDLQGNEKLFILTAINGAMLDIEAATMVERKTKALMIKSFAQQIVANQTKALKNLTLIAKGKGINPPTVLSQENLQQMGTLKTVTGNLLDKTYIKLATKSLTDADLLFGKAATFKNKDIKTFAINSLSEIQQTQKEAVAIGKQLNVSNQNNGNDLQ